MNVIDQNISNSVGFEYVKNDRMAGYVPSYSGEENLPKKPDSFGFFDLLDMINPLQHVPVVNIAYRAITGDEIKPISQIIGGAVFAGPAGVAAGLINTVIREETGQDINGHITTVASKAVNRDLNDSSVQQDQIAYQDLPVSLLRFAQTPLPKVYDQA